MMAAQLDQLSAHTTAVLRVSIRNFFLNCKFANLHTMMADLIDFWVT